MELDKIPLWPATADHVSIKQLWSLFTQYVYLPRLQNADVLLNAIRDGLARLTWESETFAYAEAWDEGSGRYLGLRAGEGGSVLMDDRTLLVKPAAARRQIDADLAARQPDPKDGGTSEPGDGGGDKPPSPPVIINGKSRAVLPQRFHGSVRLDSLRPAKQVDEIAQAIIQHLSGLVSANAEITLDIEVKVPASVPENVVRTVTENARVLKFVSAEFEES